MGAWGHQVMCNDAVLDAMFNLENSKDLKRDICQIMDNSDSMYELLFAVELIDISLNGINKDILGGFYGYDEWFKKITSLDLSEYKQDAIRMIQLIKERDLEWVESCKKERKELLDKIEERLRSGN